MRRVRPEARWELGDERSRPQSQKRLAALPSARVCPLGRRRRRRSLPDADRLERRGDRNDGSVAGASRSSPVQGFLRDRDAAVLLSGRPTVRLVRGDLHGRPCRRADPWDRDGRLRLPVIPPVHPVIAVRRRTVGVSLPGGVGIFPFANHHWFADALRPRSARRGAPGTRRRLGPGWWLAGAASALTLESLQDQGLLMLIALGIVAAVVPPAGSRRQSLARFGGSARGGASPRPDGSPALGAGLPPGTTSSIFR